MLGIPAEERRELQPHVRAAVKTLELNPPLEDLDAAAVASHVLTDHLEALIAARRAAPTDDLVSELIPASCNACAMTAR
jgi:cytochrome P450